ncbi:hypothetical protein [Streptomyces agglomeratus]|nr:hypothetical protein [Streptomyces agglomeratus]
MVLLDPSDTLDDLCVLLLVLLGECAMHAGRESQFDQAGAGASP